MSISPRIGVRALERLPCFKHNSVLNWNWQSTFALGLKAAEFTDYIKKCFKWKLLSIKFRTKNVEGALVYLPQEWSYGARKIAML